MLRALLIVGAVVAAGCRAQEPAPIGPARHGVFPAERVAVGRGHRVFRLVVPPRVDLRQPAPLVIAFHGMLIDSKDVMPVYTKLDETAAAHGFIVAFPEAVGRSWGIDPLKVIADVAFFDALVARLSAQYAIDARRIYVLGMSNGGYFAHLVGKERSEQVAAVASHSGPLGLQTLFGVGAARKFPVMIVHGDQDPIFPVAFARENRDKYRREGHVVEFFEVKGLGHAWASEQHVNERIWAFFARHALGP